VKTRRKEQHLTNIQTHEERDSVEQEEQEENICAYVENRRRRREKTNFCIRTCRKNNGERE
jgi:hypothetical protein